MPPNAGPSGGGFRKAVTSLSFLEGKLRRALGLVGDVGAKFEGTLTPVILAGDLREPGSSDGFTGRAFAWCFEQNAAQNTLSVRLDADCIIEGLYISGGANMLPFIIWMTPPGGTPDVAVSQNAGTWVDRRTSAAADIVPITQAPNWAIGGAGPAPAFTTRIFAGSGQGQHFWLPQRMMLLAGTILNYRISAAGQVNCGFFGRIWP